jgi:NAD dependent epimerase/dehydratase
LTDRPTIPMDLREKRVLITGADGFIGSHLTETLVRVGARVRALAQYNSFNDWGWLESIECRDNVEIVTGDVRDPHFCAGLTKDIDTVFHLAALIAIPFSYAAPDSYVDTNIKGTLNICQAALAAGVRRVVHTSTSEVYGTAQSVPINETHPLTPQSPYSATKIGADAIALSFHYAFKLPVVIARPFNAYGPRQSARAVIPTIISQIAAGQTEIALGDVTTTRDFTFVSDTCRGFMSIACMDGGEGEVFNIGSNSEISIGDLAALIAQLMDSHTRIVCDEARVRPAGSEVLRLRCDNTKLRERTGFQPEVSFPDGLRRTIEWLRDPHNLRRYKGGLYNV